MKKGSIPTKAGSGKRHGSLFETEKIIEALLSLKKDRKYPALPGQIRSALSLPESRIEALKEYLRGLGKEGVLVPSRKGRYRAYMLAGEDPRYATKRDDLFKLKFELLGEIEKLKGEILELEASFQDQETTGHEGGHHDVHDTEDLEEKVLRQIAALSRRRNSRTLSLWEVRSALPEIDPARLGSVLESLGTSWRLELQPVQDSTKLSPEERAALLRLSDGTLVAALAVASD